MRRFTHTHLVALTAFVLASVSCGNVARSGRSPVYLVIGSLQGSRGAASPGTPSGTLISDVVTNVTSPAPCAPASPCPTVFGDTGEVTLQLSLKDIGTPTAPTSMTSNNDVTLERYHVVYQRTDGRNTEGVDVPYAFDGGLTGTISGSAAATFSFELVRNVAKQESPLIQLTTSPTILKAIANVTFYGHDQVGNEINTTGSISVEFGNFGDQ
jgi:hypothetical protein